MMRVPDAPLRANRPEPWIEQVFACHAARKGQVVRRAIAWVEREIGTEAFLDEARRRGFQVLECAGQFIVICSAARIRRRV